MGALASWLMGFVRVALTWLYNNMIDFVQGGIDGFVEFILLVVTLFPAGPDLPLYSADYDSGLLALCLSVINWLLPIGFLVQSVTFVGSAMLAYILIAPLARWAKLLT